MSAIFTTTMGLKEKGRGWAVAAGLSLLINGVLFTALPAMKMPPAPPADAQPAYRVTVTRLQAHPTVQRPAPRPVQTQRPVKPEAPTLQKRVAPRPQPERSLSPDLKASAEIKQPSEIPVESVSPVFSEGPQIFDVSDLDSPLVSIFRRPPDYPAHARRRSIEGKVMVSFLVNPQGRVEDVTIVAAEPESMFDDSVIRGVSRWQFEPGIVAGKPVVTRVTTTIRFELTEDGP